MLTDGYNKTSKTVTFENGNTFDIYSKLTMKGGLRFYYYSYRQMRMFPVSKKVFLNA